MMCNYRLGDALLSLVFLSTFIGYLGYEAFTMKSWLHLSAAVVLIVTLILSWVINSRSRIEDDLKAHREMQQKMLGNPGEMV